jgi:hypothetical protein
MRSDESGAAGDEDAAVLVVFKRHDRFQLGLRAASSGAAGRVVSAMGGNANSFALR